jgi:pimeloyl-ACP methyl ester carboxylesterase
MTDTHQTAKTLYASNGGIQYAYRRFGTDTGVPLLFFIHFRGTMDFWDPLLINSIAKRRPVILFDNAGVGQSSGEVADTIAGMAGHAIKFLAAINVERVDLLGFSMGGYIAPLVALNGTKLR